MTSPIPFASVLSSTLAVALAVVPAVAAPPLQDAPVGPTSVPRGNAPTLDGVVGADEWRESATVARSGAVTLLARREGDTLYLGLKGVGPGITTLGLVSGDGERLFVLHASASLGTAEYQRERKGGSWKLVRPFTWAAKLPPGSPEGDAGRAAFRSAEGWLGTLTTMGAGESEIAIDVKAGAWARAVVPSPLRIAVAQLGGAPLRLPEGSSDEVFGLGLQMGTAPATLASEPTAWLELAWDEEPRSEAREGSRTESRAGSHAVAPDGGPPAIAGLRVVVSGSTWIYCRELAEAQSLVADVEGAAHDFERYFGRAPESGAVVAVPGSSLPAGCDAQLRAAGARWVLPWISTVAPPGQADALRAQIEAQLREQLRPLGMDDEQIDAQLEQVMARLAGTPQGGLGLLRHELGHVWFLAAFWGEAALAPAAAPGATAAPSAPSAHRYAGPAADWLDETAAILLESQDATALRRSSFAAWLAEHPGQLHPLDELFTMEHPVDVAAALAAAPPAAAQQGAVTVLIQAGSPEEEQGLRSFYEQCRSLADYLLAVGGERIFVPIAESAARGEDMATWLAAEGASHGLPGKTAELQQAWLEWVAAPAPQTRDDTDGER